MQETQVPSVTREYFDSVGVIQPDDIHLSIAIALDDYYNSELIFLETISCVFDMTDPDEELVKIQSRNINTLRSNRYERGFVIREFRIGEILSDAEKQNVNEEVYNRVEEINMVASYINELGDDDIDIKIMCALWKEVKKRMDETKEVIASLN